MYTIIHVHWLELPSFWAIPTYGVILPQAHNSCYICSSKVGQHTTGVGTSHSIISIVNCWAPKVKLMVECVAGFSVPVSVIICTPSRNHIPLCEVGMAGADIIVPTIKCNSQTCNVAHGKFEKWDLLCISCLGLILQCYCYMSTFSTTCAGMMASQTTDLPRPSIQVSADDLSSEQKLALRSTSFMKSNWLFRNSSTFSAPYKTWPSWRPTHQKVTNTCRCAARTC